MRRAYLPAGTSVGRFDLVRPIGNGSTAAVYEAHDAALGRRVAVKILHLPAGDPRANRAEARFLREARAAAKVRHPHVVSLFDFGIEGDLAFLVMELVEGETLAHLLARERPLGVPQTAAIMLPILSAVAQLHAHGIVHRDIKPANILLTKGDSPSSKLADFGLSRFVEDASSITESGVTLGTPDYMAPESARSARALDERSDQYSLGVVLYECVAGARPFHGETTYELMHAVVSAPVPPPSTVEPCLPTGLDSVVLRAMHREPKERFASVDELAQALAAFVSRPSYFRNRSLLGASRPRSKSGTQTALTRAATSTIHVHDGVAVAQNGDAFIVLWKGPARMGRVTWMFDLADPFASQMPRGVVSLVIVLPSASPPDGRTTIECIRRLRKLGSKTRRQATVAVGGGVWQAVVQGLQRTLLASVFRRSGRVTVSGNIHDGVARLLERKSHLTPSFAEILEDVRSLCEALDVCPSELGLQDSTER
jgi:serine/threonine protein kinase